MKVNNITVNNSIYCSKVQSFKGVHIPKRLKTDVFKTSVKKPNIKKNIKRNNRKKSLKNIAIGTVASLGIVTSAVGGALWGVQKDNDKPIIVEPNSIISEDLPVISLPEVNMPDIEIPSLEEVENFIEDNFISASKILETNEQVKENYDNLLEAVTRFSDELGEDGLALIKERVELLGNGRVEPIEVLKILWLESRGRIYQEDNPTKIIESKTGEAFGPFQVTPETADYVNYYYGLEGTDEALDVMNPYDNLDACILYLRFLQYERSEDIKDGRLLPTGEDIGCAIAWGYHDGAWADELTDEGSAYVKEYQDLCYIDEYPQVIDYLLEQTPLS